MWLFLNLWVNWAKSDNLQLHTFLITFVHIIEDVCNIHWLCFIPKVKSEVIRWNSYIIAYKMKVKSKILIKIKLSSLKMKSI